MYKAYFVNVRTGELKQTTSPKDNPTQSRYPLFDPSNGWSAISEGLYKSLASAWKL